MADTIRYYDEGLMAYLSDIKIEDGEESRSPQINLAIVSKQAAKLQLSQDMTPILPMITVTRTGLARNEATPLIKSRRRRPQLYYLTSDKDSHIGVEIMPYNLNYKIDIWSLEVSDHISLMEDMIWKCENSPAVIVNYPIYNSMLHIPGYINTYDVSDSTLYEEMADNVYRIFKAAFTITLFSYFVRKTTAVRSVRKIKQRFVTTSYTGGKENVVSEREIILG